MGLSESPQEKKHKITPLSVGVGLAIVALWIFGEHQVAGEGGNHELGMKILIALGLGVLLGPILAFRKRGLGLLLFLIGLFQGVTIPSKIRAGPQRDLLACKRNLKSISTAIDSYSAGHNGELPSKLSQLQSADGLVEVPVCPASETPYSYLPSLGSELSENGKLDTYLVHCRGSHHSSIGIPQDFPQYHGLQGLIER